MTNQHQTQIPDKNEYMGRGMAIGMIMCMPVGVALFIITGNPGLLGIGPAVGIALGVAIGEGLYQRSTRQHG
jgi:hypothetical protein